MYGSSVPLGSSLPKQRIAATRTETCIRGPSTGAAPAGLRIVPNAQVCWYVLSDTRVTGLVGEPTVRMPSDSVWNRWISAAASASGSPPPAITLT